MITTGSALAEGVQYQIKLGNRALGVLLLEESGNTARLTADLVNTPLGLADGTFSATSRFVGANAIYASESRGSKTRDTFVTRLDAIVTNVVVSPPSEMTEFSEAAKVPSGTVSPLDVFQELVNAVSCPVPMAMYDGRRVVRVSTVGSSETDHALTCEIAYRVVLGPGHFAPFYFNRVNMRATYAENGLKALTLSAGIFRLHLVKQ